MEIQQVKLALDSDNFFFRRSFLIFSMAKEKFFNFPAHRAEYIPG